MISRLNKIRNLEIALNAARAFALFPLVIGIAIFVLWLPTRVAGLMIAGLITIYAGLVSVGIALLILIDAWWLARMSGRDWPTRYWPNCRITLACIVLNFPVAFGLAVTAVTIESSNRVTVYNHTDRPLEDVRVSGGGCDETLGTIAPGSRSSVWFWVKDDGVLVLHATQGSKKHEETLVDYVSRDCGGTTNVTFGRDGKMVVDHRRAFDL